MHAQDRSIWSWLRATGVIAALGLAGQGCSVSAPPYPYDPYGYYDYYYPSSYLYVDPYYSDAWYGSPAFVLSAPLKKALSNGLRLRSQ